MPARQQRPRQTDDLLVLAVVFDYLSVLIRRYSGDIFLSTTKKRDLQYKK